MRKYFLFLSTTALLISCATHPIKRVRKNINKEFSSSFYNHQFTGLFVLDASSKDTVLNYNGATYFTPASNTKIATLFTSLSMLPKHIPAFKYLVNGDTLYIKGTADPSLLHPVFKDSTLLKFIDSYNHIAVIDDHFQDTKYGPGWAWEDFDTYYSPERSSLPIYGNTVQFFGTDTAATIPSSFSANVTIDKGYTRRLEEQNTFFIRENSTDTTYVPFKITAPLVPQLLSNASGKDVFSSKVKPVGLWKTMYSIETDTIAKEMMIVSDNFLAEQLLLASSNTLSDTIYSRIAQDFMFKSHLKDIAQKPRWVDGSGLSRYNLFTPQSLVHILQKLRNTYGEKRIFALFPAGGVSGTLENWYAGKEESPYIFAKSGSLGNNYCLSGYLKTLSGKTLIFSFMNNHYKHPTTEVKKRMEAILAYLRDTY